MTIRLTATLGAFALGLAAFAAAPVMAQGTAAAPAPAQPPAASSGSADNSLSQGMIRPMHHAKPTSHTSMHHPEHHASAHPHGSQAMRASEGDAAIARLNAESLAAAQKGRAFMPGGGGMGGGMQRGGGSGAPAGGSR